MVLVPQRNAAIAKQPVPTYTLSDLRGPVNPNLQNISNFYEGLNSGQVQHLDNAIKSGARQSVNKMGSLDNFAHIKNEVSQYPDLRGVNRKMNDVLSLAEQKIGISPYVGSIRQAIDSMTTDYPYLVNSVSSYQSK